MRHIRIEEGGNVFLEAQREGEREIWRSGVLFMCGQGEIKEGPELIISGG